MKTKISKGET